MLLVERSWAAISSSTPPTGSEFGGQSFQRPEDLEIIGDILYIAIIESPRDVVTDSDTGELQFTSELYVKIQHSEADDGDGAWAISRLGRHDDYEEDGDEEEDDN